MRATILNRMVLVAAIVALSLVGMSQWTNAQEQPQYNSQKQDAKEQKDQNRRQEQANQKQQDTQQRRQDQNNQQQARQQRQAQQQRQQDKNDQQQVQQQQDRQRRQQDSINQRQQQVQQRVQQQQQPGRLPPQRQQQLIEQQQQRTEQYRQQVDREQRIVPQRMAQLKDQKRMAQYRFSQQYQERMRQQQDRFRNDRNHDYYNDPFYYTAASYRYMRGGIFYETNQYGVNLLRQAVNYGYSEGFQAGRADRADGWRFSYQDSYAYQDATYGYMGYYVGTDDYNYYFREGFRRGYEDGFYARYRYGRYHNSTYSILDGILGGILILSSFH